MAINKQKCLEESLWEKWKILLIKLRSLQSNNIKNEDFIFQFKSFELLSYPKAHTVKNELL